MPKERGFSAMREAEGFIPIIFIIIAVIISLSAVAVVRNISQSSINSNQASNSATLRTATPSASVNPKSTSTPKPSTKASATPAPSLSSNSNNSSTNTSTANSIGIDGIPSSVDVTLTSGTSIKIADLKALVANGASSFAMIGYPTGSNNGINWTAQTGGLSNSYTVPESIQVNTGVSAGVYTGTGTIQNADTRATATFSVKVTVVNPTPAPTTAQPSYTPTSSGRYIQITSPNGGETLTAGQTYKITWNSSTLNNISLNTVDANGTAFAISCTNSSPWSDGYCNWVVNVGNTTSTQFKIQAVGYYYQPDYSTPTDSSDNYFTVNH